MKNTHRNAALAAVAALTLAAAPSALADVRVHVSLPMPPSPHQLLKHLPALPPPPVVRVERYGSSHDGRWNYENRHRDDRYAGYHHAYHDDRYVWIEGRWIARPYRGAVWVTGTYDPWGRWIPGYWTRVRYR